MEDVEIVIELDDEDIVLACLFEDLLAHHAAKPSLEDMVEDAIWEWFENGSDEELIPFFNEKDAEVITMRTGVVSFESIANAYWLSQGLTA